jgi:hypothetical protein
MATPRHVFHVLATGALWEEVAVEPGRPAGDLRFVASYDGQPAALAEARRRGSIVAPATIYVMAADGGQSEVIHIEAG